ncbi:hypothetical protein CDL12_29497 [Handroanthus impetiginosus]|uniref:Growth-regulating factor n=1 Tax=Handroanthus impetiginosus TaxID=429701 RepID=A0A2G9FY84_9LAMI|nr:hypothetical protein CDL12_29497 [Handroanthus impetiginosus]
MVYKYLVAGLPVPPDLVLLIRRSYEAISALHFHHPSLGCNSYYGKKFDPEPGRCRRTDGKKWRCSKEAHSDSKYCERHMHRGRNRSRKPVESQSTSQFLPIAVTHVSTRCSDNSGSFQHMPFYSVVSSQGSSFGSNNKESRYIHGLTADTDEHSFPLEASGSVSLGSRAGNDTMQLMPSQVSLFKQKSDSNLLGHSSAQFESMDLSKQPQLGQHCFFESNDIGSPEEQQPVHLFFSEWPTTKEESWSNLDDDHNGNVFSSTQLSISIPTTAYTTNDA